MKRKRQSPLRIPDDIKIADKRPEQFQLEAALTMWGAQKPEWSGAQ